MMKTAEQVDNSSTKRVANDDDNEEVGGLEPFTYEEYVQNDNKRLRSEVREMKEQLEQIKRQKQRADERLRQELDLRLNEKREMENISLNQRLEVEKMRKERQLLENQLRHKDEELTKIKSSLTTIGAKDDIHCDKCDFRTRAEVSLILHTINHKLSHPNQRRLILHPNMFNTRNPNSSYLYMCPICEGTALTRNEIYPHIYQNHTKEKAYKCTECEIFFTHIDYLKTHNKHEHEKRLATLRNKPAIGWEIPKEPLITAIYKPSVNRGTQTVMVSTMGGTTEVVTTSLTNTSYSTSSTSYTYSPQVMTDELLKCSFPHCAFNTNNKQKLEFHLSAHTNSKYKCPYCAYVGNILTDIYRHVKKSTKHDGKKVFECKDCKFGIDCEKSFREHLRLKHYDDDTPDKEIDAIVEDIFINKPSNGNGTEAPKQ